MSKKRRKNGSFMNGLVRTCTRVWVEMLTTAGVVRSRIGASDGSGSPSTEAGSAARAGTSASRARAVSRIFISGIDFASIGNGSFGIDGSTGAFVLHWIRSAAASFNESEVGSPFARHSRPPTGTDPISSTESTVGGRIPREPAGPPFARHSRPPTGLRFGAALDWTVGARLRANRLAAFVRRAISSRGPGFAFGAPGRREFRGARDEPIACKASSHHTIQTDHWELGTETC